MPKTPWTTPLRACQEAAFASWCAHARNDWLAVLTPGAGKTILQARIHHHALSTQLARVGFVVVPRDALRDQVARQFRSLGISADDAFANSGPVRVKSEVIVVTYQQVVAAPERYRAAVDMMGGAAVATFDEIHHAGDGSAWADALEHAFRGARRRVGLTGTPFRSDGGRIPFVRYDNGECRPDYRYSYAEALRDRVVRPVVFPMQGGRAHWIDAGGEEHESAFSDWLQKKHWSGRLRTAIEDPAWIDAVFTRAHTTLLQARGRGDHDAAGLIVAYSQEHARWLAERMEPLTGRPAPVVTSDDYDARRKFDLFATSGEPWVLSVALLSEGVDLPRWRVLVMATTWADSRLYFDQIIGRIIRYRSDLPGPQTAVAYLPDDPRYRQHAAKMTRDVQEYLKQKQPLECAPLPEKESTPSQYTALGALHQDGAVVAVGVPRTDVALVVANVVGDGRPTLDEYEELVALRKRVNRGVREVARAFTVAHRSIHSTLNERTGSTLGEADRRSLERRLEILASWQQRRFYDGYRS